ncbi:MAG TPA: hypothetical protein VGB05_10805, partial [Pyrinomonadaceae bacterium]
FASWSRDTDAEEGARISYTFNPVVRLRVVVFYGARAGTRRAEVEDALPTLDIEELPDLLRSADARTTLLGIFAAQEMRAFTLLNLIESLRGHTEPAVARAAEKAYEELLKFALEAGSARLREEKRRRPDRSILFPRLGDAHVRRQTLRWLMRDYHEANENILAVLRSGLVDKDWEVRASAMLAAVRLHATALGSDIRRVELPRTSREGPDETDRSILFAARKTVLAQLAGESPPAGASERDGLWRHLWRAVAGRPVEQYDRVFLLINALTEPLDIETDAPPVIDCVVEDDGRHSLRRTGIGLCHVAKLSHWLGAADADLVEANPVRRVAPRAGFFVARRPLSVAEALRLDPAGVTRRGAHSDDEPYMCNAAEGARLCELLGAAEGANVSMISDDEWEMAARGTDGRRYPWGNGFAGDPKKLTSPWGLEGVAGWGREWTRNFAAADERIVRGSDKDFRCAARSTVTGDDSTMAAVRFVVES